MWKMLRPDAMRVWNDPETRRRLPRYREIIDDRKRAKYLLVKDLSCGVALDESTDNLWKEHTRLHEEFTEYVTSVDNGAERNHLDKGERSFLNLKDELAQRILKECHLCERRCGADRSADEKGWCRLGSASRVSSAFLHTGEEPPLVPSGTIFFSSCCLACAFCQNADISTRPDEGQEVNPQQLALLAESLGRDGAININYVGGDPVPNTHTIIGSMLYQTNNITQLWNSSMYGSDEGMQLIADLMDIWLPDFKYGNNDCAERLSSAERYFDVVSRNHLTAYGNGEVIVRHLVLPNHLECCTLPVLEWISKNLPDCMVNIMAQYRPEHKVRKRPDAYEEISRRVSSEEMRRAEEFADLLGICWRQVS